MKLIVQYNRNRSAKVDELCICPSCRRTFIKLNYQQTFCKSNGGAVCKDKYWNQIIPTNRNNDTRICPTNKGKRYSIIV